MDRRLQHQGDAGDLRGLPRQGEVPSRALAGRGQRGAEREDALSVYPFRAGGARLRGQAAGLAAASRVPGGGGQEMPLPPPQP